MGSIIEVVHEFIYMDGCMYGPNWIGMQQVEMLYKKHNSVILCTLIGFLCITTIFFYSNKRTYQSVFCEFWGIGEASRNLEF